MPVPYNFTISDESPIFQYLPFQDGPVDASWNSTYAGNSDSAWKPSTLGVGASSHRTTLAGATVRLDWTGTAIYLCGDATPGGYTITLDETQSNARPNVPGVLFSQTGLPYRQHSLVLKVISGTTSISNATITVGMGDVGSKVTNRTIQTDTVPLQDTSFVLSNNSIWLGLQESYAAGNTPFLGRIATNTPNASVSFPITSASAFYIMGGLNFDHGPYHVTVTPPADLGAPQTTHYNGSTRWISTNGMKHLTTGLDRTRTYQVDVVVDAPQWFDMSNVTILDTPPGAFKKKSSLPAGPIAGIVVGCVFLLLSLSVCLLYFRRQRRSRKSSPPIDIDIVPYDNLYSDSVTAPRSKISRELSSGFGTQPHVGQSTSAPSYHANTSSKIQPPEAIHLSHISHTPAEPSETSSSDLLLTETTSQTQSPYTFAPGGVLTAEDARFFNNLHNLNVPAADIATMIETRRAEREAANRTAGSANVIYPLAAPPRYEYQS